MKLVEFRQNRSRTQLLQLVLTVNGVHGVGEHALKHVVGVQRVDPGLSCNRLPMEELNAQENPQLVVCATRIIAQHFHLHHHACQIQGCILY